MATRPQLRREDIELLTRLAGTVLLSGEVARYVRLKTWEKAAMFFLVVLGVFHFAYSILGITPAEMIMLLARIRPAPEAFEMFAQLFFHLFYKYYLVASIVATIIISHKRSFLPEYVYDVDALIHLIGGISGYIAMNNLMYLIVAGVCGLGQLFTARFFLTTYKSRLIQLLITLHREGVPIRLRPALARELGIPEDVQRELGILPRPAERKPEQRSETRSRSAETPPLLLTSNVRAEKREVTYV